MPKFSLKPFRPYTGPFPVKNVEYVSPRQFERDVESFKDYERRRRKYIDRLKAVAEYYDEIGDKRRLDEVIKRWNFAMDDMEAVHPESYERIGVDSPQQYITRYHTTYSGNVPSILEKGLIPKAGKGFQDALRLQGRPTTDAVFTTSRDPSSKLFTYRPGPNATLKLRIPKEEYKRLQRIDTNPEIGDYDYTKKPCYDADFKLLQSIQKGGRTDIFKERIDPKYIDKICYQDKSDINCIPVDEWMERFGKEEY